MNIVLNAVIAMVGLLAFACGSSEAVGVCRCPAARRGVTIELGCVPTAQPIVRTAADCFVCFADGSTPEGGHCAASLAPSELTLSRTDAGTCHLDVTFADGATSSLEVEFISQWRPCGSDPHGCGEALIPVTPSGSSGKLSLPAPGCSAGVDAGL